VLALTSAGAVKLWEIWGHHERPEAHRDCRLNYLRSWSDK
jgi:hypothetical protein